MQVYLKGLVVKYKKLYQNECEGLLFGDTPIELLIGVLYGVEFLDSALDIIILVEFYKCFEKKKRPTNNVRRIL